jgi:hypothetical protein
MVPFLLAFPVLLLVLMLQTTVVSTLPILSGFSDLVLLVLVAWSLQERVRTAWFWALVAGLMVGYLSAMPMMVPVVAYLAVTGLAMLIRRRVWQTPILAMYIVTFVGSIFSLGLSMAVLLFFETPLPLLDSLNLVILPGTLLNLLLALPVYAIVADMANWVYPEEFDV